MIRTKQGEIHVTPMGDRISISINKPYDWAALDLTLGDVDILIKELRNAQGDIQSLALGAKPE